MCEDTKLVVGLDVPDCMLLTCGDRRLILVDPVDCQTTITVLNEDVVFDGKLFATTVRAHSKMFAERTAALHLQQIDFAASLHLNFRYSTKFTSAGVSVLDTDGLELFCIKEFAVGVSMEHSSTDFKVDVGQVTGMYGL